MKSLDLFLPYVLPSASGAPDVLAKQALRTAAIEFCQETNLIQQVAFTNAGANDGDYDVEVPSQMQLVRVLNVMYKDTDLGLVSSEDVRSALALRGTVGTSSPQTGDPVVAYFKTPSGSSFSVYPLPSTASTGTITVKASFSPSRTATQLDDLLYDVWVDAISAGALGVLHDIPGYPFTSAAAAAKRRADFYVAISRAKSEARQGKIVAASRVRPVSFA